MSTVERSAAHESVLEKAGVDLARLIEIIKAFAGGHPAEHTLAVSCPACTAERELREIGTRLGQDVDVRGQHVVSYAEEQGRSIRATCSCGGRWVFPAGVSDGRKTEIYESHLKYFARAATVTL